MLQPHQDRLDCVHVRGLVVTAIIGVLPHERAIAQPLQIDLAIFADLRDAGRSDDLQDTANYGDISERVGDLVRGSKDILLERLAQRVAELVVAIDRVESVDVTITKLRPPIPEQLDSTAVTIHRRRHDFDIEMSESHLAIVALGSNLGDRMTYLRDAVSLFTDVESQSQVFETDPIGGPDGQGAYLNMALAVRTSLDPYSFLRYCRRIESEAGRQRIVRWGPRTLDVDILFYDNIMIDDPLLTIPHPRYAERRFVLAPLAEVAPERCPEHWDKTLPPDGVYPRGPLFPE